MERGFAVRKLLIVALFVNAVLLTGWFWQDLKTDAQVGGGAPVTPCDADPTQYSLDTNDDGGVDISDFVFGLNWFFQGTEAPRVCFAGDGDPGCPGVETRTTVEVITDYYVGLATEDWAAVGCIYAPGAVVINDQGTCSGKTDIIAALQAQADLFEHQRPTISQIDIHQNVARSLYTFDNGTVVIADGTESFVVENGQIQRHMIHAAFEFTGGGGGR